MHKRVLIIGDRPQWHLEEGLKERGALPTIINLDNEGNPMTRLKPKDLKGKMYDQMVFAMNMQFRKKSARKKLLKESIKHVDFKKGGEIDLLGLDFRNVEAFIAQSKDPVVKELLAFMTGFFKAAGFDMKAGRNTKSLAYSATRLGDCLVVSHSVNVRPVGRNWWGEINDLLATVAHQVDGAIDGMQQARKEIPEPIGTAVWYMKLRPKVEEFKAVRARLAEFAPKVQALLELPESERPMLQMPEIHSVRIYRKGKSRSASEVK